LPSAAATSRTTDVSIAASARSPAGSPSACWGNVVRAKRWNAAWVPPQVRKSLALKSAPVALRR
jgi:hypothetical protein